MCWVTFTVAISRANIAVFSKCPQSFRAVYNTIPVSTPATLY